MPRTTVQKIVICTCITDFEITPRDQPNKHVPDQMKHNIFFSTPLSVLIRGAALPSGMILGNRSKQERFPGLITGLFPARLKRLFVIPWSHVPVLRLSVTCGVRRSLCNPRLPIRCRFRPQLLHTRHHLWRESPQIIRQLIEWHPRYPIRMAYHHRVILHPGHLPHCRYVAPSFVCNTSSGRSDFDAASTSVISAGSGAAATATAGVAAGFTADAVVATALHARRYPSSFVANCGNRFSADTILPVTSVAVPFPLAIRN